MPTTIMTPHHQETFEIVPFQPTFQQEVEDLVLPIQQIEFGVKTCREDQPDGKVLYRGRDQHFTHESLPLHDLRAVHHLRRLRPDVLRRAVEDLHGIIDSADSVGSVRGQIAAALASHQSARSLDHDYWARPQPCAMLIDEVEAIWAPIAASDDWSALENKIRDIRQLGEAMSL